MKAKNKHVLFIVENASVPRDVRVWSEARAAKSFGYKVSVVCPKFSDEEPSLETIEGIEIHRHWRPVVADGKSGFFIEYGNALFWEFLFSLFVFVKKPFRLIHSANPPDNIFLIALFYRMFGVKFIFDQHDLCPEVYLAKFGRKDMIHRILALFEKWTFRVSDIVISTNESYKKVAVERGKKNERQIFVVRNGPDLAKIAFPEPNKALKNGFDHLVVYVGVIGAQESVDVLLRAARHIVYGKGVENIKFVLVGKGPRLEKMVALSKEMGLEKYVTFTGYVPYGEFYEILASADLCVNPELKNAFTDKSTMLKIMDYMTFGKPIVQFETREGRVTAGNAAVYVENNDEIEFAEKIVEVAQDRERRIVMGKNGKRRIEEKLNWEKQKSSLSKAYEYMSENI